MKTAAALILALSAALGACGGGGDDGPGEDVLLRATKTAAEPDAPNRSRNDITLDIDSGKSPVGVTGDYRVRACVTGTWRQTMRAPANLRLTLKVYGQQVQVSDKAAVAGADNRIAFSGCAETFSRTTLVVFPSGSGLITVSATDNRSGFPVDGFDVTADWTVTRLP